MLPLFQFFSPSLLAEVKPTPIPESSLPGRHFVTPYANLTLNSVYSTRGTISLTSQRFSRHNTIPFIKYCHYSKGQEIRSCEELSKFAFESRFRRHCLLECYKKCLSSYFNHPLWLVRQRTRPSSPVNDFLRRVPLFQCISDFSDLSVRLPVGCAASFSSAQTFGPVFLVNKMSQLSQPLLMQNALRSIYRHICRIVCSRTGIWAASKSLVRHLPTSARAFRFSRSGVVRPRVANVVR
jgi:hypothetical protein